MKIAAICATPRGRNTGMRCVDRALELVLAQTQFHATVDYYCLDLPKDTAQLPDALPYRPLTAFPGHNHYSTVIVWGDFLLCKGWIEQMIDLVSKREGRPEADVRAHVYDTLLPASAAQAAKMLVFGQSLQLGDDSIFDDGFYLPRLKQLLTTARLARLRDPISAHRAGMITGLPAAKFSGIDAALLLHVLDAGREDAPAAADRPVGIFLGRTDGAQLAQLGLGLALRRAGLHAAWIPWLPSKQMPAWTKMVFPMQGALVAGEHPAVSDYIAAVRGCRLIITDAYHLTLMAWSSGVPAIGIGKGRQPFTRTVHDKKKEVFFSSHYLSRYYLFSDDGPADFRRGRYRACVEQALSSGEGTAKEVQARIAVMAAENLASLKAALAGV